MNTKNALMINLLICMIIALGFTATSFVSYRSNMGILKKEAQEVTQLASESVMYQIDSMFAKSINISLTMANDKLLVNFLSSENDNLSNEKYVADMREYLGAYKKRYNYDSVFLVSDATKRYYNYKGIDRVLKEEDKNNVWYFSFLQKEQEYVINVDYDQADNNAIKVFVNCRITGKDGQTVGLVGVGFKVNSLQKMLENYDKSFGVHTWLIDKEGSIQLSTSKSGNEKHSLFSQSHYAALKKDILENVNENSGFWYENKGVHGYAIARHLTAANLYLVTDKDTSPLLSDINKQFYHGVIIIVLTTLLVIFIVARLIKKYNKILVDYTLAEELKYHHLLQGATARIYENILEFDITNDKHSGETGKKFLTHLHLPHNTTYSMYAHTLAMRHVRDGQRYSEIFSPKHIKEAHDKGSTILTCCYQFAEDGKQWRWMRDTAHLFEWGNQKDLRMIVCRQNIDVEKKRENALLEKSQRDNLTGLYNKETTQDLVERALHDGATQARHYAFLMFDINNFKMINDYLGHAKGDSILAECGKEIQAFFRASDVVGRMSGDEFVALTEYDTPENLNTRLEALCSKICKRTYGDDDSRHLSASVGVALYPEHGDTFELLYEKADRALYHAKRNTLNMYTIYGLGQIRESMPENDSTSHQKD